MEEVREAQDPAAGAAREGLSRFLPVLTEGMPWEEAEQARETFPALLTPRAAGRRPEEFEEEMRGRIRRAGSHPLGARRGMLREEPHALEVERLSVQVSGTAPPVLRGRWRWPGS
jgi:hypothetical protein